MDKLNGWAVYDKKGKIIIETFMPFPEQAKVTATIHYDKEWWELEKRGFTCKRIRFYILVR